MRGYTNAGIAAPRPYKITVAPDDLGERPPANTAPPTRVDLAWKIELGVKTRTPYALLMIWSDYASKGLVRTTSTS